jgi:hypothetical protein
MAYCQFLLHSRRKDRFIKKRSMPMIQLASTVPGWLAWCNLIFSLQIGVYCWTFYCFALLIAPLSIGPQLVRAIRLWSMFKLSHMALSRDIISVKRVNSRQISDMKRGENGTVGGWNCGTERIRAASKWMPSPHPTP